MVDPTPPADRRHDPLQFAAEAIAEREASEPQESADFGVPAEPQREESIEARPEPVQEPVTETFPAVQDAEAEVAEYDELDDESPSDPRSRRRNARGRRQAAAEKRKQERAAARALSASKRHARDRDADLQDAELVDEPFEETFDYLESLAPVAEQPADPADPVDDALNVPTVEPTVEPTI